MINHFFQVAKPRGYGGPPGIERDMRDRSHKFFLCETVFKSLFKMKLDLLDTIQRDKDCDSNQAFIALREPGTLPDIAEKKILCQLRKFRSYNLQIICRFFYIAV